MFETHNLNKTQLVSIGLPIYNGEKYLRQTLDSLLSQTYNNIEIIISDNNSSDSSIEIINEYSKKNRNIRVYFQKSNIGAAKNWKFVLEQSKGDYFFWASCDDYWHPDFISKILTCFRHKEIIAAFSFYDVIDYHTNTYVKTVFPISYTSQNKFNNLAISILNEDVLKICGIFDIKYLKSIISKLNSDDYFEIVILRYIALFGGYAIFPQKLFTYRLFQKPKFRKYNNNKTGYKFSPFYIDTFKLVNTSNMSIFKKGVMHILFSIIFLKYLKND
jgi:glycosyltransferase involved in cell wall biosynthesis